MRVPLSWLYSFLSQKLDVSTLAETLTKLGVEVEQIELYCPDFSGIEAVLIEGIFPHPHSDRLRKLDLQTSRGKVRVVCGDLTCKIGDRAAWAPPGSKLSSKVIEQSLIEGELSDGMLCGAEELGLDSAHTGVLLLPHHLPIGHLIEKELQDTLLHLSLTPNLGHCYSILGVARELASGMNLELQDPLKDSVWPSLPPALPVKIESSSACPQYTLSLFEEIHEAPLPWNLQCWLWLSGCRSISPIVDITQYVMLERGQPLHAFDAKHVVGEVKIRDGRAHESLMTLEETSTPIKDLLIIADDRTPLAIAGVMGGLESSVTPSTSSIFLEVAQFNSSKVREASKQTSLRTEAALHFEKGIDPKGLAAAIERAAQLLRAMGGKQIALTRAGEAPSLRTIPLSISWLREHLGMHLSQSEIEALLLHAHCSLKETDPLQVTVPSYRNDLETPEDLLEEVARLYGYDRLARTGEPFHLSHVGADPTYDALETLRDILVSLGLQEVLTCDLLSKDQVAAWHASNFVEIINNKSRDQSVVRPTLIPGLLDVAKSNQAHRWMSLAAFEIGNIHFKKEDQALPFEELWHVGLVACGDRETRDWDSSLTTPWDFFSMKGVIEAFSRNLGLPPEWSFLHSHHSWLHPHQQATLAWKGTPIGVLGALHPSFAASLGLRGTILIAEWQLKPFFEATSSWNPLFPPSEFPSVERDWTVALPKRLETSKMTRWIEEHRPSQLASWTLTSVYAPDPSSFEKQVTWRFAYRDSMRTLTAAEVDSMQSDLVKNILLELASVRE